MPHAHDVPARLLQGKAPAANVSALEQVGLDERQVVPGRRRRDVRVVEVAVALQPAAGVRGDVLHPAHQASAPAR